MCRTGGSWGKKAPRMAGTNHELVADEPDHRRALGLVLAASVFVVLAYAVLGEPKGHQLLPSLARYALLGSIPDWHTTEPVNEIVYGTRGFDTLGETFLLLAAVVGISVITRSKEPRRGFIGEERAGREEQAETDPHPSPDAGEVAAHRAEVQED